MGLILDTSILIGSERRGEAIEDLLRVLRSRLGEFDLGLSAVTVLELTHGIYRTKTDADRARRREFVDAAFHDLITYPLTFEIAQLAGRIEGEQAAKGVSIAFADLIIGATALHLGFDVLTLNVRHFQAIPGLNVVTL